MAMTLNQHLLVSILSIVDIYIYYICIHISYIYRYIYTTVYDVYIHNIARNPNIYFTIMSLHPDTNRLGMLHDS